MSPPTWMLAEFLDAHGMAFDGQDGHGHPGRVGMRQVVALVFTHAAVARPTAHRPGGLSVLVLEVVAVHETDRDGPVWRGTPLQHGAPPVAGALQVGHAHPPVGDLHAEPFAVIVVDDHMQGHVQAGDGLEQFRHAFAHHVQWHVGHSFGCQVLELLLDMEAFEGTCQACAQVVLDLAHPFARNVPIRADGTQRVRLLDAQATLEHVPVTIEQRVGDHHHGLGQRPGLDVPARGILEPVRVELGHHLVHRQRVGTEITERESVEPADRLSDTVGSVISEGHMEGPEGPVPAGEHPLGHGFQVLQDPERGHVGEILALLLAPLIPRRCFMLPAGPFADIMGAMVLPVCVGHDPFLHPRPRGVLLNEIHTSIINGAVAVIMPVGR